MSAPETDPVAAGSDDLRVRAFEERWGDVSHGVVVLDDRIRILWANRSLTEMLDVDLAEWVGAEPYSFVHPDDADRVLGSFAGLESHHGRRGPSVYRLVRRDGVYRQVIVAGINLLDEVDWSCLVLEIRDLDERERAQALANDEFAVLERLARHADIGDTLDDVARLVERHGNRGDCMITLVEDGVLRVAAAPNLPTELVAAFDGTPARPGDRTMGEAVDRRSDVVSADVATDPLWADDRDLLARHGYRSCWSTPILSSTDPPAVHGTVDFLRREPGEPRIEEWALHAVAARLAGLAIERSAFVAQLQHQATHDPLTGLLNRRAFVDELNARGAEDQRGVAVLFVDLDRFKIVNDTHGHELGDHVLCVIAERLDGLRQEGAVVARLGGDEFVIAWPDVATRGTAAKLAERARSMVSEPIDAGPLHLVATASVGTTLGTLGRHRPEQMIRNADAALYRAKAGGRDRCVFYDDQLHHAHLQRLGIERDLGQAVSQEQLEVHYQPLVELDSGEIVGIEALVRWHHPEQGLLEPAAFIDVAEDTGIVVELDRWVVATALRRAARWNEHRVQPLTLWVNVSTVHLTREDTVGILTRAHAGTPSVELGVELAEHRVVDDRERAVAALARLRAAGIAIAIDDFGTGQSSFDALRWFPVNQLKVDRSLVAGVLERAADRAIVAASTTLATALGLRATAEGVESAGQADEVRALGCQQAQGYYYCRPLPADELEAYLGPCLDRRWDVRLGTWRELPVAPAPLL